MKRLCHLVLGFIVAAALICPGVAAVTDTGASGFTTVNTLLIAAPPDKVWSELVRPSRWWNAAHSYSHDAANFTLDAKAGGCWCEKLPDGGSVQHLTVVLVIPQHELRLRGGLGPMQGLGVDGALTFELTVAPGGTLVKITYAAGGYIQGGFTVMAAAADRVLAEQLARLKSVAETGAPDPH